MWTLRISLGARDITGLLACYCDDVRYTCNTGPSPFGGQCEVDSVEQARCVMDLENRIARLELRTNGLLGARKGTEPPSSLG